MKATADRPRVLVVDDNEDAATTLGLLLEAAGYDVETCFDGKAALKAAGRFEPDACVLDINMPGMDGYELARRLRAKDPAHPPVLATVTAYEDYGHLTKASDAGFDLHFTKPADPAEVLDQIGDCVRKQTVERAMARANDGLADGLLAELDEGAEEDDMAVAGGPGVGAFIAIAAVTALGLGAALWVAM
jgi:two-component system OmpR family response regulator